MRFRKAMAIIFCTALMISVTACSGNKQTNSSNSSQAKSSSSLVSQGASSASISVSSKPVSNTPASVSSATKKQVASKISQKKSKGGSEWVAYIDDNQNLHIKKRDGTNDKIIVKDVEEAPCVAGEWVYFFPDLDEIDKVKLDGSQRTKVCGTDALQVYNANLNISHEINGSTSVTGEYKDGYILYKCYQLKQPEDKQPNPPFYYKLDLKQSKLIPVKK